MDTMRPVKRLDAAGSIKLSQEYVGNFRNAGSPTGTEHASGNGPSSPSKEKKRRMSSASAHAKAGRLITNDVVVPALQKRLREGFNEVELGAKEIEAVSMVQKGFENLRDANPELAYEVLLDILTGLNECVPCF
jgi:serine/threonine-protein kinase 24/25/MST4